MKILSLLFIVTLFISISCSNNESSQEFQKQSPSSKTTITVDSLLIKKAIGLMDSGRAAYAKRDLKQCEKDFFLADSILQSQEQWSLAVRNLLHIIRVAQATKQSQDSITSLYNYTNKIVSNLPKNNWEKGLFYQNKALLLHANKYFEDSKFYTQKSLSIFLSYPETSKNASVVKSSYELMANSEISLSNYNKATSLYKKILTLESRFDLHKGNSYTQLFYLNLLMGNDDEALRLMGYIEKNKVIENSSLFIAFDYYKDCAQFYLRKKEFRKALKMLVKQDELIAASPYKVHFSSWFQNQIKAHIYIYIYGRICNFNRNLK